MRPTRVGTEPSFWLMLALSVATVPWIPGINVGIQATTQQHTEDRVRGRVLGAQNATAGLVTMLGMAASSAAGDAPGTLRLLGISGGLYLVVAGGAAALLRRSTGEARPNGIVALGSAMSGRVASLYAGDPAT